MTNPSLVADPDHVRKLTNLGACEDAIAFAKGYANPQDAWDACTNPSWMMWLAGKLSSHKDIVRCALAFAKQALPNAKDERVNKCLEVVESWLNDQATLADIEAAWSAAYAAESAAWSAAWGAARSAAESAARSAAYAAESAAESSAWSAVSAARSSAWSATWSAAESSAWSAVSAARSSAWSAAWSAGLLACCNEIRKVIPKVPQ